MVHLTFVLILAAFSCILILAGFGVARLERQVSDVSGAVVAFGNQIAGVGLVAIGMISLVLLVKL